MDAFGEKRFARSGALFALCAQTVLATWLLSGTRPEFLLPMFAAALVAFALCVAGGLFARDGVFAKTLAFASLFFIIVCAVQYLNPFAEYMVREKFSFLAGRAHVEWLPVSVRAEFAQGNALSSLCALLAAFLSTLAASAFSADRRAMRGLLAFFAVNALLMGAFAVWQQAEKIPMPYGVFHTRAGFYGSFFLSNAAGAYLNMGVAALAACAAAFARRGAAGMAFSAFCAAGAAFASYASVRSESRGAAIICALLWCAILVAAVWRGLARAFGEKISAAAVSLFLFAAGAAAAFCAAEVLEPSDLLSDRQIEESAASRIAIYKSAAPLVKERPVWGVGGECSRYILPMVRKPGAESVAEAPDRPHSDVLEYLLDFGISGAAVLAACGAAWIAQIWKNRRALGFANAVCAAGALSCLAHGAFDMELHIPSTMIAFGLMCVFSFSPFCRGGRREV